MAPADEPVRPAWFAGDSEAAACWDRTTTALRTMGLLSVADGDMLAAMCWWQSTFARLAKLIDALPSDADVQDVRRLVSLANVASANYLAAAREFGLTPVARARIRVPERAGPSGPADRKARFFPDQSDGDAS